LCLRFVVNTTVHNKEKGRWVRKKERETAQPGSRLTIAFWIFLDSQQNLAFVVRVVPNATMSDDDRFYIPTDVK